MKIRSCCAIIFVALFFSGCSSMKFCKPGADRDDYNADWNYCEKRVSDESTHMYPDSAGEEMSPNIRFQKYTDFDKEVKKCMKFEKGWSECRN